MGLLQKLKNTFFEEEYVEVEEEEKVAKKVESKAKVEVKPKADRSLIEEKVKPIVKEEVKKEEPVKKEEKVIVSKYEEELDEDDDFEEKPIFSDNSVAKKNNKLSYFDDDDFVEKKYEPVKQSVPVKKEEPKKLYGQTQDMFHDLKIDAGYNGSMPYSNTNKAKFQPTPIISPIYGILDKNYNKDEIVDKKDKPSSYVSRKNADLDSIRRKAYGDVSIFDEEDNKEVLEEKEPLLYDMMVDDNKPVVDQVTMADAEEYFNDLGLEYNVDYKDAHYEKGTGRRTKRIEEEQNDIDEVIINNNTNYDDSDKTELEDNLFDLVDSIYEGGEE